MRTIVLPLITAFQRDPWASYTVDIKPVGKKAQCLGFAIEYGPTRKPKIRGWKGDNEERNVEEGEENKGRNDSREQKEKPRGHGISIELVPVKSKYFRWFNFTRFLNCSVFEIRISC
jgi:hypothetical protein